jgi:hypothetical protein
MRPLLDPLSYHILMGHRPVQLCQKVRDRLIKADRAPLLAPWRCRSGHGGATRPIVVSSICGVNYHLGTLKLGASLDHGALQFFECRLDLKRVASSVPPEMGSVPTLPRSLN